MLTHRSHTIELADAVNTGHIGYAGVLPSSVQIHAYATLLFGLFMLSAH